MSLNQVPLKPVKVLPASLDVAPKPYQVDATYRNRTLRRFSPAGTADDYRSGVNWSISVNKDVGISRRAFLSAKFQMTFQFTQRTQAQGGDYTAFPADAFAPRSYPLNRGIATQTVGMNNANFSMNNGQLMDVVTHCLDDKVHKVNCLDSVFRRDNAVEFGMMNGANNNPLRSYADGMYESPARGEGYFSYRITGVPGGQQANTIPQAVNAGDTTTRVVEFEVTEAVLCAPFYFEKDEEQTAIFGCKQLKMEINWNSLERTIWSMFYAPAPAGQTTPALPAVQGVEVLSPYLYLEFLTPPVGFSVPRRLSYDIFYMSIYSQGGQTVPPQGTQLENNNITLQNSCPTRIFVFARQSATSLSLADGNVFVPITSLSVQFNNRTGLLSGATPQQLWNLSRKNGLEQEYEEWIGRAFGTKVLSGGLICIDPSKDLSMETGNTNGVSGTNTISVTAQVANSRGADIPNVELCVVALYESVLNVEDGENFIQSNGVLSKADVLASESLEPVYESQITSLHGGKRHLGRKIGKWFKHTLSDPNLGRKIKNTVKQVKGVVDAGKDVAMMMGAGMTGAQLSGRGMTGGKRRGGKLMSRQALLDYQ